MGIFLGDSKNSSAARCALKINYVFRHILKPKFEEKYSGLKSQKLAHGIGIDTSEVLTVRGGIRSSNDLVWIGRAPNIAAKLSNLREAPYYTYITDTVYKKLADDAKFGGDPKRNMWQERTWNGGVGTLYRSSFWRKP